MQPEARDAAHLWDMIEAAHAIARFTQGLSLETYLGGDAEAIRAAVERKLKVFGEAARRLSPALRDAHPELPWREIIGLRNVISHEYEKVNYGEIYRIARFARARSWSSACFFCCLPHQSRTGNALPLRHEPTVPIRAIESVVALFDGRPLPW